MNPPLPAKPSRATVRLASCLILLGILGCLPWIKPAADVLPQTAKLIGRFHVVLLHFPIGLLAIALLLELSRLPGFARWLPPAPAPVSTLVLGLGALSAFAAALCGWLLSFGGGYDAVLLERHFYLGLASAAGGLLALIAKLISNTRPEANWPRRAALVLLAATNLVLPVAGHFGGSITHGEDYLTEFAPSAVRKLFGVTAGTPLKAPTGPVEEREVFAGVVRPILLDRCNACHNEQKAKGDLRLDTYAHTLGGAGGKAVVVAGKPDESKMLHNLKLPLDDDDHMPPKGKPQPTAEEIAILHWWIESGAPEKTKVKELNPPPAVLEALRKR